MENKKIKQILSISLTIRFVKLLYTRGNKKLFLKFKSQKLKITICTVLVKKIDNNEWNSDVDKTTTFCFFWLIR